MEAHIRRLKELFQQDVQYEIPSFQRPYVWTQEDQWEPLWEDVRNTAERYTEALELLDTELSNREARAEEAAGSHFMGAIVVQQLPKPAAEVATWKIIDGQQRMTTLQLFLHAASTVLNQLEFFSEAQRLGRLVVNQFAGGDDAFKVWPAALDREAFRTVMTDNEQAPADSSISEAHEFFFTQVREWVHSAASPVAASARVHGLQTALLGLLELVVIDLGPDDDPYVIFETLNARGTPLIASDLIKNFVLQTAERVGLDTASVYEDEWKQLEEKWWRAEVRQGRLRRPRVDVFLNYWLTTELAEEVQSHQVFTRFRNMVQGAEPKIVDTVKDLTRSASSYRSWDEIDQWSDLGTFMYRWRVLDAGVSTPLLLLLFDHLESDRNELLRSVRVLESYLVRRMVCRMTTKDYNRIFLELISQVKASSEFPSGVISRWLIDQDSESREWPDDSALRSGFVNLPLYRMLTRGRLRMVLEGLEDSLRGPKSEDEFVTRGKLTIEHLMPQQWSQHWPLDNEDGLREDAEEVRNRLVHTIGNLTLVTKSLNPVLSNGPWETKQGELQAHGVLLLNSELLREFGNRNFLEDQIRDRSRLLAERAASTWPRAVLPI